jgi:hypothetical protein
MSVLSISQRPGATGCPDEAGEPDDRELPERRPGRPPSRRAPQPPSRLERELRNHRPVVRELRSRRPVVRELRGRRPVTASELRAHRALTSELRARGPLVPEPRPGGLRGPLPPGPRPGGLRVRDLGASGLALGRRGQGVRLTRRGRRAIAGFAASIAVAAVAVLWLAAATGVQAANHGLAPAMVYKSMTPVVVQPGQTLWAIALRAEPTADPRIVISQIIEFNALGSDVVVPGERLWVPKS